MRQACFFDMVMNLTLDVARIFNIHGLSKEFPYLRSEGLQFLETEIRFEYEVGTSRQDIIRAAGKLLDLVHSTLRTDPNVSLYSLWGLDARSKF